MNIRSMYRVRTRQCQRGVPIYLPFQAHKVNKQQARSQDISQGVGVQTAGPQPGYFLGGQGANSRPVARIFPRGRGANSRTVVRIFPRGPGCKQQARSQDISQGAGVQTAGPQPGYFLGGQGANSRPVARIFPRRLGGRGANSRTVAWIFPRGPGCKQQARGQDIPQGVAKRGVVVWDQDHQVKRSKKFCSFNLRTNNFIVCRLFSYLSTPLVFQLELNATVKIRFFLNLMF